MHTFKRCFIVCESWGVFDDVKQVVEKETGIRDIDWDSKLYPAMEELENTDPKSGHILLINLEGEKCQPMPPHIKVLDVSIVELPWELRTLEFDEIWVITESETIFKSVRNMVEGMTFSKPVSHFESMKDLGIPSFEKNFLVVNLMETPLNPDLRNVEILDTDIFDLRKAMKHKLKWRE
ncbi:hypothetical protein ACFL13_01745 [Patescibacteria group bacterium]